MAHTYGWLTVPKYCLPFAAFRCANCEITHKLIDNLNLFHELRGPVFPATPGPADLDLPPGLPAPHPDWLV